MSDESDRIARLEEWRQLHDRRSLEGFTSNKEDHDEILDRLSRVEAKLLWAGGVLSVLGLLAGSAVGFLVAHGVDFIRWIMRTN